MLTLRLCRAGLLPILLFALILSAGCGSKEPAPVDPAAVKNGLVGKVWSCEAMFEREVRGEAPMTLEFLADGTVKGNGGCNDFSGQYTLDGDSLSFGPFVSTKKACGPATDEQEYAFMTFLPRISRVEVDDDELHLFSEETPLPMAFSSGGGGLFW